MLEIWAQIIDFYRGRFRFEIVLLLHNSSVCISKSIGVRLNIYINISMNRCFGGICHQKSSLGHKNSAFGSLAIRDSSNI